MAELETWLLDVGYCPRLVKFIDKENVIRSVITHELHTKSLASDLQFQKGADKLWSYVVKYPDTMKALFVCDVGSKLSFDVMMKLYDITWSPEGSTRKALEEMTVYSFEASLQVLEEGCNPITLKDLLAFWTGADSIPPGGFDEKLKVDFFSLDDTGPGRLPSASTCSLTIWLPRGIENPDTMLDMLTDAYQLSGGFGKI